MKSLTIELPDELCDRLAALAQVRGVSVGELAVEILTKSFGASAAKEPTALLVPATPADLLLLRTFLRSLRADDPMPAGTLADDATAAAAVADLIADPTLGRAWTIRLGGEPVGYAVLTFVHSIEFGGRCGFLDELYVAPAARGRGVGRRALDLVAAAATDLGVRVLLLELSPGNEPARRLYESSGFAERKYRLMAKRLDVAGHS